MYATIPRSPPKTRCASKVRAAGVLNLRSNGVKVNARHTPKPRSTGQGSASSLRQGLFPLTQSPPTTNKFRTKFPRPLPVFTLVPAGCKSFAVSGCLKSLKPRSATPTPDNIRPVSFKTPCIYYMSTYYVPIYYILNVIYYTCIYIYIYMIPHPEPLSHEARDDSPGCRAGEARRACSSCLFLRGF